jgi:hypothetical protein
MDALLDRFLSAIRSLGNEGALTNVQLDLEAAAADHLAVDRLEQRLAAHDAVWVPHAA